MKKPRGVPSWGGVLHSFHRSLSSSQRATCVFSERAWMPILYRGTGDFMDGFHAHRCREEFGFRLAWRKDSLAHAPTFSRISRYGDTIPIDDRKSNLRNPLWSWWRAPDRCASSVSSLEASGRKDS